MLSDSIGNKGVGVDMTNEMIERDISNVVNLCIKMKQYKIALDTLERVRSTYSKYNEDYLKVVGAEKNETAL